MKRVEDTELEYDNYAAFYNGEVYTGESVEVDKDGSIIALTTYEKGYEHGPSLEWYPGGRIKVEGRVDMGNGAVGTWRHWHENGQLSEERTFDEGGRMLSLREWNIEGEIVRDEVYSNPL